MLSSRKKIFKVLAIFIVSASMLVLLLPQEALAESSFWSKLGDATLSAVFPPLGAYIAITDAIEDFQGLFGLAQIAGSVIGWIVFVVNFIINLIASFFIAVLTWFVGLFIGLSEHVADTLAVQKGFSI